jgi:hypothetical protein
MREFPITTDSPMFKEADDTSILLWNRALGFEVDIALSTLLL